MTDKDSEQQMQSDLKDFHGLGTTGSSALSDAQRRMLHDMIRQNQRVVAIPKDDSASDESDSDYSDDLKGYEEMKPQSARFHLFDSRGLPKVSSDVLQSSNLEDVQPSISVAQEQFDASEIESMGAKLGTKPNISISSPNSTNLMDEALMGTDSDSSFSKTQQHLSDLLEQSKRLREQLNNSLGFDSDDGRIPRANLKLGDLRDLRLSDSFEMEDDITSSEGERAFGRFTPGVAQKAGMDDILEEMRLRSSQRMNDSFSSSNPYGDDSLNRPLPKNAIVGDEPDSESSEEETSENETSDQEEDQEGEDGLHDLVLYGESLKDELLSAAAELRTYENLRVQLENPRLAAILQSRAQRGLKKGARPPNRMGRHQDSFVSNDEDSDDVSEVNEEQMSQSMDSYVKRIQEKEAVEKAKDSQENLIKAKVALDEAKSRLNHLEALSQTMQQDIENAKQKSEVKRPSVEDIRKDLEIARKAEPKKDPMASPSRKPILSEPRRQIPHVSIPQTKPAAEISLPKPVKKPRVIRQRRPKFSSKEEALFKAMVDEDRKGANHVVEELRSVGSLGQLNELGHIGLTPPASRRIEEPFSERPIYKKEEFDAQLGGRENILRDSLASLSSLRSMKSNNSLTSSTVQEIRNLLGLVDPNDVEISDESLVARMEQSDESRVRDSDATGDVTITDDGDSRSDEEGDTAGEGETGEGETGESGEAESDRQEESGDSDHESESYSSKSLAHDLLTLLLESDEQGETIAFVLCLLAELLHISTEEDRLKCLRFVGHMARSAERQEGEKHRGVVKKVKDTNELRDSVDFFVSHMNASPNKSLKGSIGTDSQGSVEPWTVKRRPVPQEPSEKSEDKKDDSEDSDSFVPSGSSDEEETYDTPDDSGASDAEREFEKIEKLPEQPESDFDSDVSSDADVTDSETTSERYEPLVITAVGMRLKEIEMADHEDGRSKKQTRIDVGMINTIIGFIFHFVHHTDELESNLRKVMNSFLGLPLSFCKRQLLNSLSELMCPTPPSPVSSSIAEAVSSHLQNENYDDVVIDEATSSSSADSNGGELEQWDVESTDSGESDKAMIDKQEEDPNYGVTLEDVEALDAELVEKEIPGSLDKPVGDENEGIKP